MKPSVFSLCLLMLCCQQYSVQASKILLLPAMSPSHILYFAELGEELVENGHDVYMLFSSRFQKPKRLDDSPVKLLFYNAKDPEFTSSSQTDEMFIKYVESVLENPDKIDYVRTLRQYPTAVTTLCTNPIRDMQLFNTLQKMKLDFALLDGLIVSRCMYALTYKLGIPYGTLVTMFEPWLARTPALPSFVPFSVRNAFTEKMSFWERLYNVYSIIDMYSWPRINNADDKYVSEYVPEKPFKSLTYLAGQSQLWLVNTDVAIDYPLPLMPNVIPVGGLTTRPAKPLPSDFENFVKDAEHGFIVVSFGGLIQAFPDYLLEKLVHAFGQVKEKVIFRWKNVDQIKNRPQNLLVHKWIPQNDLLGHHKARLFITHSGNNGQFEALYHGIPMLGFPVLADQRYNAVRMQYKGYGIAMTLGNFTAEELVTNINEVISNTSYRDNIKLGSEIFKSQEMTPRERAAYWIEHVLEFGGDHLHSHALEMPWYEYVMLDIIAFLMVCLTGAVYLVCCILSRLYKLMFGTSSSRNKMKTQ